MFNAASSCTEALIERTNAYWTMSYFFDMVFLAVIVHILAQSFSSPSAMPHIVCLLPGAYASHSWGESAACMHAPASGLPSSLFKSLQHCRHPHLPCYGQRVEKVCVCCRVRFLAEVSILTGGSPSCSGKAHKLGYPGDIGTSVQIRSKSLRL